jgi:cytochrome subunit of sulfide dehydrogenase
MKPIRWTMIAGAVMAAAMTATAQPATAQNADARLIANACATCHAPGGRSPGQIPSIYGRSEASLAELMRAFRADQRPGTTVMNRLAKGYTDAEIDSVARYIATNWK